MRIIFRKVREISKQTPEQWAPLFGLNRTTKLCIEEGLSRKMLLDGAMSNKGLLGSGYPL